MLPLLRLLRRSDLRAGLNHPHAAICSDAALNILCHAAQRRLHCRRRRSNAQHRFLQHTLPPLSTEHLGRHP